MVMCNSDVVMINGDGNTVLYELACLLNAFHNDVKTAFNDEFADLQIKAIAEFALLTPEDLAETAANLGLSAQ